MLHNEYGDLELYIPRDRNGEFKQQTVSNMTKAMAEQVDAFAKWMLAMRYVCVYIDATYIAVRCDTVSKERCTWLLWYSRRWI